MNRRDLVASLAVGSLLAGDDPVLGQPSPEQNPMQSFTSGGVQIAVEWFPALPGGAAVAHGRSPAVLLLHGAEGLAFGNGYRLGAQMVAQAGYHVAFVHYLDRTGERRVSYATLRERFPAWADTVGDAVTWLAARPDVDPGRIGIVGVSLGASLAMETASHDDRVRALIDYFGPVPDDVAARKPRLPPTLILHGSTDRIVPVGHAHVLETLLKRSGTPYEIKIYEGQGHGFVGLAQLDSAARVSAFLAQHLDAPIPAAAAASPR